MLFSWSHLIRLKVSELMSFVAPNKQVILSGGSYLTCVPVSIQVNHLLALAYFNRQCGRLYIIIICKDRKNVWAVEANPSDTMAHGVVYYAIKEIFGCFYSFFIEVTSEVLLP